MKAELITPDEVFFLCHDDELRDRVSDIEIDLKKWQPSKDFDYLGLITDELFIGGFWSIKDFNYATVEVHCNILKDYRKTLAPVATTLLCQWLLENKQPFNAVVAFIPEIYPDVLAYCEKQAMEHTGTIKGGYNMSNGYCDLLMYTCDIDNVIRLASKDDGFFNGLETS